MKRHYFTCDIAVIGAGPAGLSAAITAARAGKKVMLFEKNAYLGGSLAIGLSPLGFLDKQGRKCIAGFAEEFINRLVERGDCLGTCRCPKHNSVTCVNAEGVKLLAFELCKEAGVDVLLHCETLRVEKRDNRIARAVLYGKCNEVYVEAKIYIDGTGDGDLAYLAGCSYEIGQAQSGHLQPPTVMFTLGGVDQERLLDYVEKHPEELRYNDPLIYENPDYTADHFRRNPSHVFVGLQETFRRLKEQGKLPVERASFIYINGTHPGEVYVNSIRLTKTDATNLLELSKAEMEGAMQIPKLISALKENAPGFENCYLSGIAPSIGIRETRRFSGIRKITGEDVKKAAVPGDTICLSGYKVDIHSGSDAGLYFCDVEKPFGIPFGCMVSSEIDNLMFAGRCISADSFALGSLRVIPTCMVMGQAAAVGAGIALDENICVKDVDVNKVREQLLRQNAILSLD